MVHRHRTGGPGHPPDNSAAPGPSGKRSVATGELGADAGQLGLDGSRFEDFDQAAPPGQVPGDVERSGCGDADPGTSVVFVSAVGVTVPPEVITQDRHEPGLDQDGRPGSRAPLFDLADDLLPTRRRG